MRFTLYIVLIAAVCMSTAAAQQNTASQSASATTNGVTVQQFTVTGTVTEQGQPMPGVNVVVKDMGIGVITDVSGRYSINVPGENMVLQFSFVGYATQEFPVGSQRVIDVTMREGSQELEEIVVTGYSVERKRDLTGAVAVVKMDEVENVVSSNIMQTLQGHVPGLFITSSGNPNGDATIRIRGVNTLSNSDPLYIIDGVPTTASMNTLSPQDIESVQVLKDASAASIYGSRASNGVIIITTKKADRETSSVSFRSSVNVKTYAQKPLDWLNTEERGWAQWKAYRNDGGDPNNFPYSYVDHQDANGNWVLDRIVLPEWIDASSANPGMRPADTDWVSEVMQTSVTQNYNLTVSTGGEKGRAMLALDYLDNVGQIKGTYAKRMSLRINSDYSVIKDRLTVGENIAISKIKRSTLSGTGILGRTQQIQPIIPIHTEDGVGWGGNYGAMDDNGHNPVREIEWSKDNNENTIRLFGNVFADLEIVKNLHFRTTLGLDQRISYRRVMTLPYANGSGVSPLSRVESRFDRDGTFIWNNTLTYSRSFGYHNLDFLLGHEQTDTNEDEQIYTRDDYDSLDPNYMYIFSGGSTTVPGGSASQSRLLSYFGKVNYNYRDKYLASFTLRRDGSSRFGADTRFATFPAFSLGWRLSEESFFKTAVPAVSDLKLRYGWGMTGNQAGIGDFAAQGLYAAMYNGSWANEGVYDQSTAYDITGVGSGIRPMGYRRTQMANRNLRWEASTQNNLGIDFGLFNQKLTGSADYFFIKTTDILVTPPTIGVFGEGANRTVNGASMENKGYEFLLSYRDQKGELRYTVSANVSGYRNKVTELPNEVITEYAGNGVDKTIIGRERSVFFGYYADGIFKSEDEVNDHVTQDGKGVGRIRYRDIGGPGGTGADGQITTADRDFIGKTEPDFIYGLSVNLQYRQWDFNMFWNGVKGSYSNVGTTKRNYFFIGAAGHTGQNYGRGTLDAWSYENPDSDIPRLSMRDLNREGGSNAASRSNSTFFLENTSYFRLRNLEIGYTIPRALSSQILIQNARVYVMGQNLLKLYKKNGKQAFTGADPETPGTAYPLPLSFTVGLNVTF